MATPSPRSGVAEVALNRTRWRSPPKCTSGWRRDGHTSGGLAQHAVVYGITTGFGFIEVEIGSAES